MAIFAVAGIPWLASVLGALFGGLLTFFAQFLTKKLALTAAFVTASLGLFGVFFSVIWGLMQGINFAAPPELGMALSFIVPSNAPACLSVILSAHVARWIYDWNTRVLQFRLNL